MSDLCSIHLCLYHLYHSPSHHLSRCLSLFWFLSSAPHSGAGSPLAKWPPAHYAPWYNNSTSCTGLIFVSLRAMRGLCLSFSMTAVHTYLPFYFEAWLTGWQPWHSCRRCGACYYAYINILINTWSAIEEIITCHHSTVWKECALLCVRVCTYTCLFHPINMISVPLVPPCPLMSSTAAPLIWKALWDSTASLRTHARITYYPARFETQITHSCVSDAFSVFNRAMEKQHFGFVTF